MSDVSIETVTLEDDTTRLPLGVGLLIGACASAGLWALILAGVKRLAHPQPRKTA